MLNTASGAEHLFRHGAGRPLVLIVMDDEQLRATFAYQLTASGFDVVVIGVAAIEIAARRPDVVVAALADERETGGLSARILRTDPRAHGVPIIAVAADVSDATRNLARREGCAAVCLATCTGSALATGLRAVLDRTS